MAIISTSTWRVAEEMAHFVEQILGGRIELKERRGIFLTKVSTYWLITSTIRRRIQNELLLAPDDQARTSASLPH